MKHKNELIINNNSNEKQNNYSQLKSINKNQTNRISIKNSSNNLSKNTTHFDIEFGSNLQKPNEPNLTTNLSSNQTVALKTTIKTDKSNSYPQKPKDNLNCKDNTNMSSTASELLNLSSNNAQNNTSNATIVSATNANQTPNEQQRRNKKRKPPNYYQSAEYANIIKHSQELSNQTNTSTSTTETSTTVQSSNQSESPNEIKQEQEQQLTNGTTQDEAVVAINAKSEIQNDNTHSQRENSTNDLSESLKSISLNEQASQQQQQQQQSHESNQNESSKKWSSLFKATAANAASVTNQVASPKQTNNKTSSNKSNQVQKTAALNSNQQPVNGHSSSSSVSSLAEQVASPMTNASTSDSLKTLGNFFKSCELKHSAPALQPRGIRNKQNWCYVNATLQALLACPPFYNLMRNVHQKIKTSNINVKEVPCLTAMSRFINEFKVMVRTQQNESSKPSKDLVIGEPFEIEYFYNILSELKFELALKSGRQEDAQEFLSALLNKLHEEMTKCLESLSLTNSSTSTVYTETVLNHSKTNGNSSNDLKPNENNLEEDDEWKEVGKKNRAFITRKVSLFY